MTVIVRENVCNKEKKT